MAKDTNEATTSYKLPFYVRHRYLPVTVSSFVTVPISKIVTGQFTCCDGWLPSTVANSSTVPTCLNHPVTVCFYGTLTSNNRLDFYNGRDIARVQLTFTVLKYNGNKFGNCSAC